MKKRLLDFRENSSKKKKIIMVIITFIIALIGEIIVIGLYSRFYYSPIKFVLLFIFTAIVFSMSAFVIFLTDDIWYIKRAKKFERIEDEAHKRVKLILTNEFKTFSLKTDGDYNYFTRILVEEVPYVFKARMENDIIYYQFETKDGEIFHTGEFTGYSFFEEHTKS